jgi:hypothetical protein
MIREFIRPTWVKVLGMISILLAIGILSLFLYAWMDCVERTCDGLGIGLFVMFIIVPPLAFIFGAWLLSFLFYYLKTREKVLIAKIIAIIGLLVASGWLLSMLHAHLIVKNLLSPYFVIGMSSVPVIYFVIALILLSRRRLD